MNVELLKLAISRVATQAPQARAVHLKVGMLPRGEGRNTVVFKIETGLDRQIEPIILEKLRGVEITASVKAFRTAFEVNGFEVFEREADWLSHLQATDDAGVSYAALVGRTLGRSAEANA